jgi:hypothetical protein
MNIRLLFETVVHLKPTQIIYQLIRRSDARGLTIVDAPESNNPKAIAAPIAKPVSLANGVLTFLNISDSFTDWNQTAHGALWNYNQNYMDWLLQPDLLPKEGIEWIDRFIENLPTNTAGLAPYPTALRSINWCKFFSLHQPFKNKERDTALYSQVKWLENNLEYRVLGNHLLEDAYALFIAAIYFSDAKLYVKASRLLNQQLQEQVLPDGAHYEQSPMYHCIMLDRLLDCINFSIHNDVFANQASLTKQLITVAERMLGHLQTIIYQDKTIPLLNDSAEGIAPLPCELFDYAQRLGIQWRALPLNECGYRKLVNGQVQMEAVVDIGNIQATYQPGHSHADTFNYELRWKGCPYIVDTGISTYEKGVRRQYERSTLAHNTVSIDGQDSSHVWGGFRVGKRARVTIEEDTPTRITARHDGFGSKKLHQRTFSISDSGFSIEDKVIGKASSAISYLHVAPDIEVGTDRLAEGLITIGSLQLSVEGHNEIEILHNSVAKEYNKLTETTVIAIHFTTTVRYQIQQK